MGIFGALTTAVTGLRAQSYALENISGNIANSQTTAFKRTDTSFTDLIPDSDPRRQVAGSVTASSRGTNAVQGDIQASSNATFLALNGDGYFVISEASGQVDGRPVFSGTDLYTRRGDFDLSKDGYLVNGAGYYLKALPIDRTTGNISGSVPQVLQFGNDILPAAATSEIQYRGNLPSYPLTNEADPTVPDSELLDLADYATDPSNGVGADGYVQGGDATTFLNQSISGGATTVYDTQGSPINVQFRWAKMDNTTGGGSDTWNLFYQSNTDPGTTDPAWVNVGTNYVFGTNGQLNPSINSATIANLTVNGNNLGNISLLHGAQGITQFSDPNGTMNITTLNQNGYAAGEVVRLSISNGGRISAFYSNGQVADIAEIPTVYFNADNQLKRLDGGAFAATFESGQPIPGAGATILGASLEGSNTDIADEFTKLIVTQQAYAANTRIITTANDMLQESLNMLR